MTIIFKLERDTAHYTANTVPWHTLRTEIGLDDRSKLSSPISSHHWFLPESLPELLHRPRQSRRSTKHSANITSAFNILIPYLGGLSRNLFFEVPHHSHVYGWHPREKAQPTLTPALPCPSSIKATASELNACTSCQERKESESKSRSMVYR